MAEAPGSNPGRSIKKLKEVFALKIAIISDTHDNVARVEKLLAVLKLESPDLLIHCGDVVSPRTADMFKDFKTVFVKGNCDGEVQGLKAKIQSFGSFYPEYFETVNDGKKLFATHGHLPVLKQAIESGDYWIVAHGHTHQFKKELHGKTLVLNPGALYDSDFGGVFFIDTKTETVRFKQV